MSSWLGRLCIDSVFVRWRSCFFLARGALVSVLKHFLFVVVCLSLSPLLLPYLLCPFLLLSFAVPPKNSWEKLSLSEVFIFVPSLFPVLQQPRPKSNFPKGVVSIPSPFGVVSIPSPLDVVSSPSPCCQQVYQVSAPWSASAGRVIAHNLVNPLASVYYLSPVLGLTSPRRPRSKTDDHFSLISVWIIFFSLPPLRYLPFYTACSWVLTLPLLWTRVPVFRATS